MLDSALKESAAVCRALATGRQSLILQKADTNSTWEFGQGPTRFWLWPTYDSAGVPATKPEAANLEKEAAAQRTVAGTVRLTHFADVAGVYHVQDEAAVSAISALHIWTDNATREMFRQPPPGLIVVPVRVYGAAIPVELSEKAGSVAYDQWTFLDRPLETLIAEPVLGTEQFREIVRKLDAILKPTAMA